MSFFAYEIVTPPAHIPVTVAAAQTALAAAVVEECERLILWRGIVAQTRRILIDGPLPERLLIEPATILTLTRWVAGDDYVVIPEASYYSVTRDPHGTIIAPNGSWPAPERAIGSFALTYECGWEVTPESSPGVSGDAVNEVPAAVRLMVERAIVFRAGSGVGDIAIGSVKISVADSYSTDAIPPEVAGIGRSWAYRPGIFAARP